MKVLVLGGTRFFGIHAVDQLLKNGHEVTIATRGNAGDHFGTDVHRLILERTDEHSMKETLSPLYFDTVIDNLAYCSNDIKYAMEALHCKKYICMSTTAVYEPKRINTVETDFDAAHYDWVWCSRNEFPYDQMKRHAECALWQVYPDRNFVAVRYPFVIGRDDYTNRLRFYIEHTIKGIPMYVDNLKSQMGFVRSDEAGQFLAYLVDHDIAGAVNGCSFGTVALNEIIEYVECKTGKKAIFDKAGENAPYNGEPSYSINTEKAAALGFRFSTLTDWIYDLVDYYITQTK